MSSVVIAGDTSGSVTLQAPAVSGSTVLTLPTSSGTVLTTASGQVLTAPVLGTPASGSLVNCTNVNYTGFKNRIINGGMVIDQRNAGASVTGSTTNPFSVDRWQTVSTQNSKFTAQQNANSVTPPAGFINYLGITSSSAYSVVAADQFRIFQSIEGLNVADLAWGTANAATVTLSFRVYSSLTGTFGGSLANNAYARSYPFTYTISTANTWTTISVTIAGDTSGTWLTTNGNGVIVSFGLGVGSTLSGTAGAWATASYVSATGAVSVVGTSGATFYITGVQLEKGSVATSFDQRAYGTELALCQRYYWPLRGTTATPSFIARTNAGAVGQGPGLNLKFPQPMRTAPTATQVGSWTQTNTSGGAGPTTPSCFTTDYVTFYVDSAAAGDCFYYLNGTSNGFNFSAEL